MHCGGTMSHDISHDIQKKRKASTRLMKLKSNRTSWVSLISCVACCIVCCKAVRYNDRKPNYAEYPDGYFALCIIAREASGYLREFVEYHNCVGASKIYVYAHNSGPAMRNEISDFIQTGVVEYVDFKFRQKRWDIQGSLSCRQFMMTAQGQAYHRCLKANRHRHHWIGFIDIDEFIVLKPGRYANMPEFLAQYEDYGGMSLYWRWMGAKEMYHTKPRGGVIANYLNCLGTNNRHHHIVKSIINTKHRSLMCNAHTPAFWRPPANASRLLPGQLGTGSASQNLAGAQDASTLQRHLAMDSYNADAAGQLTAAAGHLRGQQPQRAQHAGDDAWPSSASHTEPAVHDHSYLSDEDAADEDYEQATAAAPGHSPAAARQLLEVAGSTAASRADTPPASVATGAVKPWEVVIGTEDIRALPVMDPTVARTITNKSMLTVDEKFDRILRIGGRRPTYQYVGLYHYFLKSFEEYRRKMQLGGGNGQSRPMTLWNYVSKNAVSTCPHALQFYQQCKAQKVAQELNNEGVAAGLQPSSGKPGGNWGWDRSAPVAGPEEEKSAAEADELMNMQPEDLEEEKEGGLDLGAGDPGAE